MNTRSRSLLIAALICAATAGLLIGCKPLSSPPVKCRRTYDDTIFVRLDSLPDSVTFGGCSRNARG